MKTIKLTTTKAKLDYLIEQVSGLKTDMSSLKTDVSELKKDMKEVKGNVNDLIDQNAEILRKIATQDDLSALEKRLTAI